MTEPTAPVTPTGIKLHRKSRLLEISFTDEQRFMYPCEYLRVFAPTSPGQGQGGVVNGKQRVEIAQLEPQGTVSLQLTFDDGFCATLDWQRLHELGVNYERNWQGYLQVLQDHHLPRDTDRVTAADGKVTVKLVYFIQLARLTGKDEEQVELPAAVTSVETLLTWLGTRRPGWQEAFTADKVQVTVNRHFSEPFTRIEHGDEVALVPRAVRR